VCLTDVGEARLLLEEERLTAIIGMLVNMLP
jgi:hypothetical protein